MTLLGQQEGSSRSLPQAKHSWNHSCGSFQKHGTLLVGDGSTQRFKGSFKGKLSFNGNKAKMSDFMGHILLVGNGANPRFSWGPLYKFLIKNDHFSAPSFVTQVLDIPYPPIIFDLT